MAFDNEMPFWVRSKGCTFRVPRPRMQPMREYRLYTRPGCHLCDDALDICREGGLRPEAVDISDDLGLVRDYGDRIPVLHCVDTGDELGWPFDCDALTRFIANQD